MSWRKNKKMAVNNIACFLKQREIKDKIACHLQHKLHVTEDFVNRLGLEKELEGHMGCVNCLEWNETGMILASASDDVQVILWDPFRHKKLRTIQTGHHGNIFSVKFLPKSNDNTVMTGAGDSKIRIHDVNLGETTHVCSCHNGRVKRLATAPNVPYMFWSAAEDGTVMQFDLRTPHTCSAEVNNVLVNLPNHLGRYAEAKCLAINPLRPEYLAVGANDPYVRLYDRRLIKPTSVQYPPDAPRTNWERQNYVTSRAGEGEPEDNLPPGCVQYFVAGHLPVKLQDYKKRYRNLASTYLTFSASGNELLVNLGGEQIYLFDINNKRKPKTFDIQAVNIESLKSCRELCSASNGYSNGYRNGSNGFSTSSNGVTRGSNGVMPFTSLSVPGFSSSCSSSTSEHANAKKTPLPIRAEALKLRANNAFEKQQYTLAISLYNKAISICPSSAILYGNRAAAFMKRSWDGDVYAAMRDCHTALQLDPNHLKAHFRLARCLYELQWTQEASDCLQVFKAKFPEQAQSHACKALDKDIQTASASKSDSDGETEDQDSSPNSSSGKQSTSTTSSSQVHRLPISEQERHWRSLAYDYESRFCGHCNTTTDIKEANFFGREGQYIVAGSDDGSFFIWDRQTTNIMRVLRGDDSIVNCLQPHPSYCLLATSGIDPVVRLWSPRPEDGSKNDREVIDLDDAASANQKRMNADPFEVMLMNMGYRITSIQGDEDGEEEGSTAAMQGAAINCRPS